MMQDEPILNWINQFLSIPARIGILPTFKFLKIPELEKDIRCAGFKIAETETIPFGPPHQQTSITGYFIAARKDIS